MKTSLPPPSARKTYSYTQDSFPEAQCQKDVQLHTGLIPRGSVPERRTVTHRTHCRQVCSPHAVPTAPWRPQVMTRLHPRHSKLPPSLLSLFCHIMCYLGLSIPPSLLSSATLCVIWVSPYNRSFQFIQSLVVSGKGVGGGGGGGAASDNFLLLGLLLAYCSCEHWHFWVGPVFDVLYPPQSFSVCLCVFALRGVLQGGV